MPTTIKVSRFQTQVSNQSYIYVCLYDTYICIYVAHIYMCVAH